MTQQEFNQMLAVAIASGLGGGTYVSRWDGEEIDDGIATLLAPGGVGTTQLATSAVTTAKLAAAAVTAAKLGGGAVTTDKLGDGAVTWTKLAQDARRINDNLLYNSYFIGGGSQQGGGQFPINEKGKTSYSTSGVSYTLDGWRCEDGFLVKLVSDGVIITPPANAWATVVQMIENYTDLLGKELTLSVLVKENTCSAVRLWMYGGVNTALGTLNIPAGGSGVYSVTLTPTGAAKYLRCGIQGMNSTGSIKIQAFKLELGNHQTLAHKDAAGNWVINDPSPNYQQELAKCQRYFVSLMRGTWGVVGTGIGYNSTRAFCFVPLPVPLRAKPVIDFQGNVVLASGNDVIPVKGLIVDKITANGINVYADVDPGTPLTAGRPYELWMRGAGGASDPHIYLDCNL